MFCLVAGVSGITSVNAASDKTWRAGHVLVKPRAGLPASEFKNILKRNNVQSLESIGSLKVHMVRVPEQAEQAVVRALSRNPHVEFAEQLVLEDSADEIAGAWHPYYGNGRVNAAAAVQLAMTMDTIPVDNEAPVVNIFSPAAGTLYRWCIKQRGQWRVTQLQIENP